MSSESQLVIIGITVPKFRILGLRVTQTMPSVSYKGRTEVLIVTLALSPQKHCYGLTISRMAKRTQENDSKPIHCAFPWCSSKRIEKLVQGLYSHLILQYGIIIYSCIYIIHCCPCRTYAHHLHNVHIVQGTT